MTMDLKVLKCGNCEELKLGVHAMALGLAALCGLYNAAEIALWNKNPSRTALPA